MESERRPLPRKVTIEMDCFVAFELRWLLPILAEALGASPDADQTKAMLEEACADIGRGLPTQLRDMVDEDAIAEFRMDVIAKQWEIGDRPLPNQGEETR